MRTILLGFCSLSLILAVAQAQTVTVPPPSAPPSHAAQQDKTTGAQDFSAEPAVIERLDSVYKMAPDGTGSKVTTAVIRVQTDASVKQAGVLSIPYSAGSQHLEIVYARIRRPDGTVVETPVSQALDMPAPVTQAAPFYSDLKQLQLPIRNLSVGDKLEWQVKVQFTRSEATGEFWGLENFAEDGVVLSQTLELRVPKNLYVNVWSKTIKPVETTDGDERVYRWVSSQLKPTVGKEAEAEKERKKKQVWTPGSRAGCEAGEAAIGGVDDLQELGGGWRLVPGA